MVVPYYTISLGLFTFLTWFEFKQFTCLSLLLPLKFIPMTLSSLYKGTKHNDTEHNDAKYDSNQHNDTNRKNTQHNDHQCKTRRITVVIMMIASIMTLSKPTLDIIFII